MKKIAVIEDDIYIGDLIEKILRRENYDVIRAYSGTEASLIIKEIDVDLILLDLMLPGKSGEDVLKEINNNIPVIILSAKLDIDDKVQNLLNGACDYVTKPFDTKELLARIEVQLRKRQNNNSKQLVYNNLIMNLVTYSLTVDNIAVKLTKTEFAILKVFLENPNRVFSKSQILDKISGDTLDGEESSLNTHISNLRGKLFRASGHNFIEAVWGIGYKLA